MSAAALRARYRRIVTFFAGVTIGFIWWELVLPKVGFGRLTNRTRLERNRRIAVRFRALAISMGGLMIKVGQFMSARLDVLPAEITDELAGLQDEVPAAPFDQIKVLAEAEVGPLSAAYASFDPSPLAAASLGQAHRAVLLPSDAEEVGFDHVVVKVQRPDIDKIVETDLSALRRVGGWLARYKPVSSRADVPALVEEFAITTLQEIDYLAEASNAEHFREVFAHDRQIRVPQVAWERTTRRVLTLEDVSAIRLGDYAAIEAAGIDRALVAEKLIETYMQQIFTDGVFHADPHPGNLFVAPPTDADGDFGLTFIDFGMVGRVPDNLRAGLREALIAVGTQDATRLVKSFKTLNVLLPSADIKLIELAGAQVFDRFGGMAMGDLQGISHEELMSFGLQFRDLMVAMPFQLPENLLLLGRTLAILSGMCTGLDPSFNLWTAIAPYATKLISADGTGGSTWQSLLSGGTKTLQSLAVLPVRADRIMTTVERGDLVVKTPMLDLRVRGLERAVGRASLALIFAALLVAGAVLYPTERTLATVFMIASAVPLLASIRPRGHRPR